jgi:hypothetical protein
MWITLLLLMDQSMISLKGQVFFYCASLKRRSRQDFYSGVVIAGTSWSGLSPQRWLDRLVTLYGAPYSSHDLMFQHLDGTPWDSYYFRNTLSIPSLVEQRLRGDAHLCDLMGPPTTL